MKQLRNDYRWGNLRLISGYQTPSYAEGPKGRYVADTHGGPYMWRLRCDCGYEWEIPENEFPGRRALRSCGRKECTVTAKPPRKVRVVKTTLSLSLAVDTINGIRQYQTAKNLSLSSAANILLDKGLASVLIEDD